MMNQSNHYTNNRCIQDLLKEYAERTPDAVAIETPGRKPLSYAQLWKQMCYVVRKLNQFGVGRNDRVAIVLPNGPEMAVAFLSVAAAATSAPLNPNYRASENEFYLSDLNVKALIVQSGIDTPAADVAQGLGIAVIELSPLLDAEAGIFALKGRESSHAIQDGFAQSDDVALILHTSGTTSRPKIVPLTQTNICISAQDIRKTFNLTDNDRCLNVMPLFHIHGLIGGLLSMLAAGASVVCTPGFDALKFFEWMQKFRPTWYTAVPTMHQAILARAEEHNKIIQQNPLRFIRSCSASLPHKVMARLEDLFGVPVVESYGMTEASHQMTSNPLPPGQRKPGSVGIAAGPEVAIMDEEGSLLPADRIGEIVIRGANVTQGYENNTSANMSSFTDGWFRTGDQGYLDTDNYLFITGRLKEIINRGGEKVAPKEIDEAILEHPNVTQAVAFAVPHSGLGEDIAVAVVFKEDAVVSEKEIREFLFDRLADYKVPSQIVILDKIPKGPTGKLQRIGLADKLAFNLKPEYVAPESPAEKTLADIWAEILGVAQVGIRDNFFSLGGDSLSATRAISRVRSVFQMELPLKMFFMDPTVSGQALIIENVILEEIEGLDEKEAIRLSKVDGN
jgi:acyl-CoA synthetase (AMP-forming)/AMP-acid ligase II